MKALGLIPSRARLIESLSLIPKNWTFESPAVRTHKCLWREFRYFLAWHCAWKHTEISQTVLEISELQKKINDIYRLETFNSSDVYYMPGFYIVILGIFGFWISLFQLATISRSFSQSALSLFHVKCVCQVWLASKLKNTIDLWKCFVCNKKYQINLQAIQINTFFLVNLAL